MWTFSFKPVAALEKGDQFVVIFPAENRFTFDLLGQWSTVAGKTLKHTPSNLLLKTNISTTTLNVVHSPVKK